jgi:signal transduction histidine kinase
MVNKLEGGPMEKPKLWGKQSLNTEAKAPGRQLKELMQTLQKVNGKLRESEASKSNFLSNMRNEINNPLTSILGLTEQIINGLHMDSGPLRRLAEMIYTEALYLDFHLRNIFIAAELEAGEQLLYTAAVRLDMLIQSTIQYFKHKAEKKKIAVCCSYQTVYETEEADRFRTDPEKLKLILLNLLSNALKFSPEGGKVELEVQHTLKNLVFSVKDHGLGFDRPDQSVIFARFRQLDNGMSRQHEGYGLGLSITKNLVALFGGSITVDGAKGKGSIFTVSIPEAESLVESNSFSDDGNVFVF